MPTKAKDNMDDLTLPVLEKTFSISAFGPVLLTQTLLPKAIAAPEPRHIAVMSFRAGSIADDTSRGYLAYRALKTAVNSFLETIALDVQAKHIIVSMRHPSFAKTNLDADTWRIPGAVEPGEAASKL